MASTATCDTAESHCLNTHNMFLVQHAVFMRLLKPKMGKPEHAETERYDVAGLGNAPC